jgi:hypothetical protein
VVHWQSNSLKINIILAEKITAEVYVNRDKSLSDLQTLIKHSFLFYFLHELLMSFLNNERNLAFESRYTAYITRKYMHAETLALQTKPLYFPNMKYLK